MKKHLLADAPCPQDRGEGGNTVIGAAMISALVMVLIVAAALMLASFMASRAATAADLASLAAADAYRGLNTGDPCEAALQVAMANRASLLSCELEGEDTVRVRTQVQPPGPLSWLPWPAEGKARAGPPADR